MTEASDVSLPLYRSILEPGREPLLNTSLTDDICPPYWQMCDFMYFLTSVEADKELNNMTMSLNLTDDTINRTESFNGTIPEVVLALTNSSLTHSLQDKDKAIALDEINHLLKSLVKAAGESKTTDLDADLTFSIKHQAAPNLSPSENLRVSVALKSNS